MTKLTGPMLNRFLDVLLEERWCQDYEARTATGEPCQYDDKAATQWCICGAAAKALGVAKAFEVYPALLGILAGDKPSRGAQSIGQYYANAFAKLSEWNDRPETTWFVVYARIKAYRDRIAPPQRKRGRPRKCAVTV